MMLDTAEFEWRLGIPYSSQFQSEYSPSKDILRGHYDAFLSPNKLLQKWQSLGESDSFSLGEIGFGTGVNFLSCCELWLKTAPKSATLYYFSVESTPFCKSDLEQFAALWPSLNTLYQELLENYPAAIKGFHNIDIGNGRIKLCLMQGNIQEQLTALGESDSSKYCLHRKKGINAWFLNHFLVQEKSSLWHSKIPQTIASLSAESASLSTYGVASNVINQLESAGFKINIEDIPGHKYQILSAQFQTNERHHKPPSQGANQWHLDKRSNITLDRQSKITIIGAGISGCTTAAALSKRGYRVTVVDRHAIAGQEGSGNPQAIIYPKLSTQENTLPLINLHAIMYAARFYKPFWDQGFGQQCGVLVLPKSGTSDTNFYQIAEKFSTTPAFVELVHQREMACYSGISLDASHGLFFPTLGWVPPSLVCQKLLKDHNISIVQEDISQIEWNQQSQQWSLFTGSGSPTMTSDTVVIANAHDCENFEQTSFLGINKLRGQITEYPATKQSQCLATVICGEGYIVPAKNGFHGLGASYNIDVHDKTVRPADHQTNLSKINSTDSAIGAILRGSHTKVVEPSDIRGRANFRCTTRDYLPIVGPVPVAERMLSDFDFLRTDARKNSTQLGTYHPNLFINCGMGSRGLGYAPLTAELLAADISHELAPLERGLRKAMHPSRFIIRDLKKKRV
ncbi:MAG: bifunctional tRNA (5-methylaminomethyl-2-thiouridine)(34)-methyltransferase MnmD/FAD-dependent 5-carboxymethylaminomethyl-2-thiouridine(34) oxidoreductase MnmC [Porticoccaceae bacterium]|nr:bifunctional tRNA (5-methylaminomethyl-2-thiouridine)(34)-methyltransferase MnmD/FAD-dependent 5-carboxymethylaminomethyl-2-thiouridine(34) oxidoreductase MnmC [Porticoccaceae bacterium]MDG1474437.1 bifunctional tRNA (5-methylaminomethyl-2-thiouridine)(34)-methyltransferase MnmD/FAD-dependent 5-carboxymethylaminomethyl-2-thiouridine(34) oxidoreductase MnmC [Porticoccaceae bacterium]